MSAPVNGSRTLLRGLARAKRQALSAASASSSRNIATTSSTAASTSSSPIASSSSSSSVHPDEVAHFTRLSSTWWDPHGELALLHKMNKGRVAFLQSKLNEVEGWDRTLAGEKSTGGMAEEKRREREWAKGKKVLDVGCGGGLLSESLARLGASVHGIDATSTNISIARHHASLDPFFTPSRLTYSPIPAEDLPSDHLGSYDIVASVEVLEHVSSPAAFLHSLAKLVKPGGHLLLSTISRTWLARLLTITMAEEVLGLVSKGTHNYEKFIKSEELKRFIREEEGGGLGWYPSSSEKSKIMDEQIVQDAFGPRPSSRSGHSSTPERLQIESRGIIYDPLLGDWRLLDRSSALQRSGWAEECNYLLWARKPLTSSS